MTPPDRAKQEGYNPSHVDKVQPPHHYRDIFNHQLTILRQGDNGVESDPEETSSNKLFRRWEQTMSTCSFIVRLGGFQGDGPGEAVETEEINSPMCEAVKKDMAEITWPAFSRTLTGTSLNNRDIKNLNG
jgi:hypothetical protein